MTTCITRPLPLALWISMLVTPFLNAQKQELTSPDQRLKMEIRIGKGISWSAALDGNKVIESADISMSLDAGRVLGRNPKLLSHEMQLKKELFEPVVHHKDAVIPTEYKELTLNFENYQIVFRAYNDGVAYRFVDQDSQTKTVSGEELSLRLPPGSDSFFPKEESMYSHNERTYLHKNLSDLYPGDFCSLPVLFTTGTARVLLTEASLYDYPGMFLSKAKGDRMHAVFPEYVLKAVPDSLNSPDRNQLLVAKANYIARVQGARSYPWRVFVISDDDRTFVETNLVTQLSDRPVLQDTGWIRPGKVAWDWYNANNIFGVDFKAGLNTDTYKYYIDFAADNGIEYVILDEGWTRSTTEILESNPDLDVEALINYGKARNVGIILWVLWKPLQENLEEILSTYSTWGAKGVKVDFMQRNDQAMVSSYEHIAERAAHYRLLVDYHGAFKPSGIARRWPNLINYEGVKGNEHNKWSADINPEHNLTIPFIRMAAGPMDFTPGAMVNKNSRNFAISFFRPMSLGTRCHQIAMYVVYEAPLQMMCESPSIYKREQETVDFVTSIPTTWEETHVLQAAVSDYIVVARRNGDSWYVGAMTDDTARDFELRFDFLEAGSYEMELFRDGVNASHFAEDYKREVLSVDTNTPIAISMVSGGGWVAILKKK